VITRAAIALAAVVVLAWLGVMERDARLQARANTALGHLRTSAQAARAEADLRRARLLNPDAAPDLSRVLLYQARGRWREGVALADRVVRREPDNLTAWLLLRSVAGDHDPGAVRRAQAALRRLDPLDAR
jgi:hypothetical protein